jgi:ribosomal protein S6--L-glutamate ligase
MNIASRRPEIYYNGEKLKGYDAVIPRIGASVTFYGTAVLRQFEMMGVYPLNESVAIGRSRDKLRSMQLLARDGIGLPVTTFAHDPKQTEEVLKVAGGRAAGHQAAGGHAGLGVVLADTTARPNR